MQRALRFVAIPVTFFAGACVARALLRHAPASIAIDRAQPLLVVTAWGAFGANAFAALAATLLLATGALAFARPALERRTSLAPLLAVAAASVVTCASWPFVFSSDVYAYAAYGDLVTHGITPYAVAPGDVHDALLDATRWQWSGTFPPCVYGPVFVAFAAASVAAAHAFALSTAATLELFRLTALGAFLATIGCAELALRDLDARMRSRALVLASLNPVVIWSVAEGHNDVYALLAVAAIAAIARGRFSLLSQGSIPLAMLVKATAGLAAVALAFEMTLVRKRPALPIALATTAGCAVAAAIAIPPLVPALRAVASHGRFAPSVSLIGSIGVLPALAVAWALGAVAIVALSRGNRAGYAWLGLAAFVALPNPYPWYGLVLVPLAVAGRGRSAIALYGVTISAAMRYLPDAVGDMSHGASLAASAVTLAPLAFALTGLRHDLIPQKDRPTP